MNLELLLMLAGIVNRVTEAIKRLPIFERVPEDWRDEAILIISWILGILLVGLLAPDQNLLADMPGVHELVGKAFTGIIVASGANALHWFVDLINKRAEPLRTNVNIDATNTVAANKIVEAVQEQKAAA